MQKTEQEAPFCLNQICCVPLCLDMALKRQEMGLLIDNLSFIEKSVLPCTTLMTPQE